MTPFNNIYTGRLASKVSEGGVARFRMNVEKEADGRTFSTYVTIKAFKSSGLIDQIRTLTDDDLFTIRGYVSFNPAKDGFDAEQFTEAHELEVHTTARAATTAATQEPALQPAGNVDGGRYF